MRFSNFGRAGHASISDSMLVSHLRLYFSSETAFIGAAFLTDHASSLAQSAELFPLNVALVYDDTDAGRRAMQVLERMESEAAHGIRLSPVLWRFDRLSRLLWRCHASDDVIEAEFVVLSLSHPGSVPEFIADWFATCMERKRAHHAIVLMQRRADGRWGTSVCSENDRSQVACLRGSLFERWGSGKIAGDEGAQR